MDRYDQSAVEIPLSRNVKGSVSGSGERSRRLLPIGKVQALALAASLILLPPAFGAEDPVKNGDFSQGLKEWQPRAKNKEKQVTVVDEQENPGNKALKLVLDPAEGVGVTQEMRVIKAMEKLTVTLRAKASPDFASEGEFKNTVVVRVDGANLSKDAQWSFKAHYVKRGGDWVTFTAPLNAKTVGRAIKLSVSVGKGVGTVWIDDIVVSARD